MENGKFEKFVELRRDFIKSANNEDYSKAIAIFEQMKQLFETGEKVK